MALGLFSLRCMFVEVADDVLRKALRLSDNENEEAIECLRHLALAIRHNCHLVYLPTLDFNILQEMEKFLNKAEIKAFTFSFAKKNNLRIIRQHLTARIEISFLSETTKDGDVIKIRPGKSNRFDLFERCHLLTENLLDAKFYDSVSSSFQKRNRIDECVFGISYYPLQGGGVTIKDVFLMECGLGKHLCLAILDSDKKWPNYHGYGETATKFEEEYDGYLNKHNEPITCSYYVMQNTNEIENLIPIQILNHVSSPTQKGFLARHANAIPFFDMKKGFDFKLLYKDNARQEWSAVLPDETDWNGLERLKNASTDEKDFVEKAMNAGIKFETQPWGTNLLDKVVNPEFRKKDKVNLRKIDFNSMLAAQKTEWDLIGSKMFSWCCCFVNKNF